VKASSRRPSRHLIAHPDSPLAQAVEGYMRHARTVTQSEDSIKCRRSYLRSFLAFCERRGVLSPEKIDRDLPGLYVRQLQIEGKRVGTQVVAASRLKSFLVWMHEGGLIARVFKCPHPPPDRRVPQIFSTAELLSMFRVCRADTRPIGLRDVALLEFLWATGARACEAWALNVSDLDFEARTVVLHGKGRRDRVLPLLQSAVDALRTYLGPRVASSRGAVFLSAHGRRLSRANIFDMVRRRAREAGIDREHIGPHLVRHSFATRLHQEGADLLQLARLLGHARPETTARYAQSSPGQLAATLERCHPRGEGEHDDHGRVVLSRAQYDEMIAKIEGLKAEQARSRLSLVREA
jgi:integrase/recombinase XerD